LNTDKAVRYHRLRRRTAVAGTVVSAAALLSLLVTGSSALLRDAVAVNDSPAAGIAAYVVVLGLLLQAAALPLAYYSSVVIDRRYGLSTESTAQWLRDYVKGALVSIVMWIGAAEGLYLTVRQWPQAWWIAAAVGFGAAALLVAQIAPIVLLPLFYRFTPLARPELQERLRALSRRAGLPVLGVYEWGLGSKTRRANAALVGVGATRRILLSDTLLEDYSDDEVEVILAHELGHHAHRDVLKTVTAQACVLVVSFGAAAAVMNLALTVSRLQLTGASDVAGLPLIVLVGAGVALALTPLMHALSRLHERRADAFALRLTGRPAAFVSAMRRLGAQNLAEPHPSRTALWLFHSHPPIAERIATAEKRGQSPFFEIGQSEKKGTVPLFQNRTVGEKGDCPLFSSAGEGGMGDPGAGGPRDPTAA
jgi:STE24 endopeptidase